MTLSGAARVQNRGAVVSVSVSSRTHPIAGRVAGPAPRAVTAALGVVAALVLLAACGSSGRTLRDPAPGATAPPRPTSSTTAAATTVAPIGLSIVSPAWEPGGEIPEAFTCDGAGTSPPLTVGGAAEGTVELVVVVTAPQDAGLVHWVVAGLDPIEAVIAEGTAPDGAVVARNGLGLTGFEPFCPTGGTQTYEFTVYAFDEPTGITADTPVAETEQLLEAATALAVLTGTVAA